MCISEDGTLIPLVTIPLVNSDSFNPDFGRHTYAHDVPDRFNAALFLKTDMLLLFGLITYSG